MMHKRRIVTAAVVAALVVAGCGGDDDEQAAGTADTTGSTTERAGEGATVVIETFEFRPDPMVVPAGTTLTFVNQDAIDHTVTAGTREDPTPEVFDVDLPEKGSTVEITLAEPGTYDYFCRIHPGPGMTASIRVQ